MTQILADKMHRHLGVYSVTTSQCWGGVGELFHPYAFRSQTFIVLENDK
jgi:hypothetical protein